ncbi:MAG: MXAN_6640 family putative metalloprotease [Nocardioides sp.]
MRRSIVTVVVAAALVLSVPGPGSAGSVAPQRASATASGPTSPEQALATVQRLLAEEAGARGRTAGGGRPEVTLAMRDLFVALPRLDTDDRRTAQGLLARPTDGASDPFEDGYTTGSRKKCSKHVCLHWVESTADAPPGRGWVNTTLSRMNKVWSAEVGRLGYRKPISDKRRGGNSKFDVYLKELGSRGLYGYCAPERRARGQQWLASGFCVLDNDFARAQYGAPPRATLRVTAAHEFFHAVQFAMDFGEDKWLMEGTATWMEERVADAVDDNRQYLPYGQVGSPGQPLDKFDPGGFNQYGNWAFFEHLSNRFGVGIVKKIWHRAGTYPGAGRRYSTAAVAGVLAKRGGFVDAYRRFAAANTVPGRSYPEGDRWPTAATTASWKLSKARPATSTRMKINHLASRNVKVRPDDSLRGKRWKLRVVVDGPARRTSPAAYLVVKRKDGLHRSPIRLNKAGKGTMTTSFNAATVAWSKVVLVNASTRFTCGRGTWWSCRGKPRDNNLSFRLRVAAVQTST